MRTNFAIVVLLLCMGIVTFAQKPVVIEDCCWSKIGTISASFQKMSEVIFIASNEEFGSIKLRAMDVPITIENVQIFFEGGKVQQADVNQALNAGQHTVAINLYAENKKLDKVVFAYTSQDEQSEKAEVELYGNKQGSNPTSMTTHEFDSTYQTKETATDTTEENQNEANAEGKFKDEKLESKAGPNGETIYIDDNKNYYWVNEKGEKRFVSVLDLIDR